MSIPITDKFKPKGTGGFALVDAEDVEMPDGTRLHERMPVFLTQDAHDALKAAGEINENTPYFIIEEDTT